MSTLVANQHGSYGHPDDPGEPSTGVSRISVTDAEANLLAELARGRWVLEIGTGLGVSTKALARYAIKVATLDIDPWVQQNIWPTLPESISCFSDRAGVPAPFDMVFIDGSHKPEDFLEDVRYAEQMCPTGMIVAHDADELAAHISFDWYRINTRYGLAIEVRA